MTIRIALYQPDIPQNCGTLLRLAACLGVETDIIEPMGFVWNDRQLRRAGLDYLDKADIVRHADFAPFLDFQRAWGRRPVLLTTAATTPFTDFRFMPRDTLLLGRESAGVTDEVRAEIASQVRIPMKPGLRSLNVAIAGAMALTEALRQTGGFDTGNE